MQNITPQSAQGAPLVEAYGVQGFRIAGNHYAGSVLVTPQQVHPLHITDINALTLEALFPALAGDTEVLLLGTGAQHAMIPPILKAALKARGIGCDSMDTGAAARTFNVLLSEARNVSAVLILSTNS